MARCLCCLEDSLPIARHEREAFPITQPPASPPADLRQVGEPRRGQLAQPAAQELPSWPHNHELNECMLSEAAKLWSGSLHSKSWLIQDSGFLSLLLPDKALQT